MNDHLQKKQSKKKIWKERCQETQLLVKKLEKCIEERTLLFQELQSRVDFLEKGIQVKIHNHITQALTLSTPKVFKPECSWTMKTIFSISVF